MTEYNTKTIVEDWLNELVEELSNESLERLRKALEEGSTDELNPKEIFLYNFLEEFKNDWGYLPISIL